MQINVLFQPPQLDKIQLHMRIQVHAALPIEFWSHTNTNVMADALLSCCKPDTLLYLDSTALFHPQKWLLEEWSVG